MKISFSDLPEIRDRHAADTLAYTAGCFDVLHRGHLDLLTSLRRFGGVTVVGVTPDIRVAQKKGQSRPVQDEDTRLAVIESLRQVDYAFLTPESEPDGYRFVGEAVVKHLRPDVLLTNDQAWEHDRDWLTEQGTEIEFPGVYTLFSTTRILQRYIDRLSR